MSTQHKNIAEADLHEPKGVSTATTGTFSKASGGVVTWTFQEYILNLDIVDIDTAADYYVVSPYAGTISKIYSVIDATIATADNTLTASIGGVAVTNGAITIAYSGSAAGDVDSCTPSAANAVTAGQAIKIAVGGASTNACRCHIIVVIQRTA